jgi:hypothetical protein
MVPQRWAAKVNVTDLYKQGSEGSEAQNRAVEGQDARNGGLEAQNGSLKDLQTSSSRGYHQYDEEQDPEEQKAGSGYARKGCWSATLLIHRSGQMCGIKFWKGNKNLRSVYKKPFFEILSSFFHFWSFKYPKRFIVSSKWWKFFFFG